MRSRTYLDYNSTSPLANSVKQIFTDGLIGFENSSSIHSSGKRIKKYINQTRSFLYSLFSISEKDFDLVFHSGTTEFINTLVKGLSLSSFNDKQKFTFIYSLCDHACVLNQKHFLDILGQKSFALEVGRSGVLPLNLEFITSKSNEKYLLNYTWVNNETGIVSSLKHAKELKEKYNCIVHVDATQAVGKVSDWKNLDKNLDVYSFSGHKFGALKGIGFSFIKRGLNIEPLICGGGQHELRSGTENSYGIYSLKLALEELVLNEKNYSNDKDIFENLLLENLNNEIEIIGKDYVRNFNTSCILFKNIDIQTLFMKIDMAGFDISLGSACGTNLANPSQAIMAMGYSEKDAKNIVRISLPFKSFISDSDTLGANLKRLSHLLLSK